MLQKSSNEYIPPGFKLSHTLLSFLGQIDHFAWSPDGQVLALSFTNNTIRLWNIERKTQAPSSSNDKCVLLWDRETRKLLSKSPQGQWMRCVAWSSDGQMLASGSDDRIVRCWERESGKTIQLLQGHSAVVRSVAWSPDGQFL